MHNNVNSAGVQLVDYDSWNRKEIFEFFSHVSDPYYMVSFAIDVTRLYAFCKRKGLSFYLSMIHVCTSALNSVENFRYAIIDGKVCIVECRHPSFTDIRRGEELFHITTVRYNENCEEFVHTAREESNRQTCFISNETETEDLVYFSCLPGVQLTALTNERERKDPAAADSNITSIAWGKFIETGEKKELNIAIEVNHRFIDGIHISRFAEAIDSNIDILCGEGTTK